MKVSVLFFFFLVISLQDLPDFYSIKVRDFDYVLFRRFSSCKFYYSFSNENYTYFFNNTAERWELGQNMKIKESCEYDRTHYEGPTYYYHRTKEDVGKTSYLDNVEGIGNQMLITSLNIEEKMKKLEF